ncbi:MAG: CoA transferase [Burkholderiales bacterium]
MKTHTTTAQSTPADAPASAPLTGLRVLDLGWVMVGPMSGRYLADMGADVIKIESSRRLDPLRTLGPFRDGKPNPERSLSYHFINAGKRGLTLDLNTETGREIVRALVRKADVLIESFTGGVIDRMGLGWERLRAENPALIMVSTCLFGQTGPERSVSGVGTLGAAYAGASALIGWPDRPPTGPHGPWTDSVTPRFIVASVLAALHRRRRTGQGCYIDVAQAEAGLQFLLPAYFEQAANGRSPRRVGGDADPLRSPSGVFPCAGDDRWVAIDASADAHWRALRALAPAVLTEPVFDTLVGRLRQRERLHAALGEWTATQDALDLERRLQAVGVPAQRVCQANDLAGDEDLLHDGYFGAIEDPQIGPMKIRNPMFSLEPAGVIAARPAPRLGDATDAILREVGGYSDAQVAQFRQDGVLA